MNNQIVVQPDHLLWALGRLTQISRIPFDSQLILQQFAPPYTLETVQHAAKALGFKVGLREAASSEIVHLAQPCLGVLKPVALSEPVNAKAADSGIALPAAEHQDHPLVLIAKADHERVSFFEPERQDATSLSLAEFDERFQGQLILFSHEPAQAAVEETQAPRFDFHWFVPELLKHREIWRDVLLASLAIQLMALATPLFTQVVIDKVIVHHTQSTLLVISVALTIFMLFTAAMSWVRQYLVLHTGNRVDAVLGLQVMEHMLRLPPRYFESRASGTLVARMLGVETIREFVTGAAVTLVLDVPFLLIFLAIMFYYSVTLSFITLAVLLLVAALSVAVTPLLREKVNRQFLLGARNQAFLTEYISAMDTVKSLQMEPQLQEKFGAYLASYLQAGFDSRQLSNAYNVAANTLEQLLTLAILCVGAYLVMSGTDFTIGMLVAFQMFASRLSGPMLRMVGLWQEFQQAAIAVQRLGDVMNAPIETYSLTPSRTGISEGSIEISNLSFRYGENLPFLYRDLSLKIAPGECLALTGPSGCGKSTLAKLLQGFYQPTDGGIRIDGRDIHNLSANELRQNFGIVPQEIRLFSGTIYDNLILAHPHATFEQVVEACRQAEIHDTIEQLPRGYQTPIGEHGAGLSGGQKQRLAIARALLKKPKILIFDEATSNLDQTNAERIVETINQLKGKVTMIFIAHEAPKGLKADKLATLGAQGPN